MQTVEAIIDENGRVELLEDVTLPEKRRALLTILEDAPRNVTDSSGQTLAEKWVDKEKFLQAVNDADADAEDDDEKDLREFMRLAQARTFENLDEWK